MTQQMQWEYRVKTLGSALREPRDSEVASLLNALAVEGWELVQATHTSGNKLMLIVRRPLSGSERRRRSYPE